MPDNITFDNIMPDNNISNNTTVNNNEPIKWQELLDETMGISIHKMGNQEIHRNLNFIKEERNRQLLEEEDYEGRVPRAYVARFDRR